MNQMTEQQRREWMATLRTPPGGMPRLPIPERRRELVEIVHDALGRGDDRQAALMVAGELSELGVAAQLEALHAALPEYVAACRRELQA